MLYRNVGNYLSTLRNIPEQRRSQDKLNKFRITRYVARREQTLKKLWENQLKEATSGK